MLNVHDLERRWLKYKIKSFFPLILASTLAIIVIVSFLNYIIKSTPQDTNIKKVELITPKVTSVSKQPEPSTTVIEEQLHIPQNTQEEVIQEEKALVLKPSLDFMNNIEEGLNPYIDENEFLDEKPSSLNEEETDLEPIIQIKQKSSSNPPEVKKGGLKISTQKNENDLKDVIRRFKKNKNPALSLFIAKRYYQLGKYQKSYNYALMTNEIDKNIDESWIIFSKSLVKLGQHELAIVTLKSYLKSSQSTQAEILLRKIESGSFK